MNIDNSDRWVRPQTLSEWSVIPIEWKDLHGHWNEIMKFVDHYTEGRFYIENHCIGFEFEKDALVFKLKVSHALV